MSIDLSSNFTQLPLDLEVMNKVYSKLPYSFAIVRFDELSKEAAFRKCHLEYANPATEELGITHHENGVIGALTEYIENLTPEHKSYHLFYDAAIDGKYYENEEYSPFLKKYINFSSYQYAPGYAGFFLKNCTESHLAEAALKSTIFSYIKVYHLRLDDNYYQEISYSDETVSECGDYTQAIAEHLSKGIIYPENAEEISHFLSLENLRSSLSCQDYIEMKYKRKINDTDYGWCITNFTVSERFNGQPLSVTMCIRNIEHIVREEEKTRKALADAAKLAESANKAKTDFFSTMSHDMRTPLNVIIGMSYLAKLHCGDPKRVADCLDKINTASNHLLTLINDVLDMSKIEYGQVELNINNFLLPDMVNDVILMSRNILPDKHHKILFDIHSLEHEALIGDKNRLIQILLNLLSNCIKYTDDDGTISLDIREITFDQYDSVSYPLPKPLSKGCSLFQFIVKDNGIGMSDEFLQHIFEPFRREQDSRVNKVAGTGLGMTITKKILDIMGGTIDINSEVGTGTEFLVRIPLRLQDDELLTSSFPNDKILIIDDYEAKTGSVKNLLTSLQVRCECVSSGKEAMPLLLASMRSEDPFTCAIIDYELPEDNGIMVAEVIRTLCGSSFPMIMTSSEDLSLIQDETLNSGMNLTLLSKPVFRSNLVHSLYQIHKVSDDTAASKSGDFSGVNAILAEDNELNAEIAGELLSHLGLSITTVYNGREAIDTFLSSPPGTYSCIFMDLQMPVMNGLEATKAIRDSKRPDSDIPIFAMTANVFADDVAAAIDAGMYEHISKPLDLEKIEKILNRWFS